ncbi:MAG TPA: HdeD family acid-resistance protein [Gaiellaceae bacterium]|nr:HdeD family acid-resistance protein [Gaiellaceae bacterium]
MDTMLDRAAKNVRTQITKMRWMLGLHGLASVVLGVMILAWPGISVYALTIVFGAYTLATGIVEFGSAFTAQGSDERGWLILRGLLGITVGVLVFAWPGTSALALLYVIGGYAVALGILFVVGSFRLPLDRSDRASMILTGVVPIVFGIVIFAKPGAGALAVLALIAAFALVTGISELVVAIGGEKLFERTAKAFAPPRKSPKATPEPSH